MAAPTRMCIKLLSKFSQIKQIQASEIPIVKFAEGVNDAEDNLQNSIIGVQLASFLTSSFYSQSIVATPTRDICLRQFCCIRIN